MSEEIRVKGLSELAAFLQQLPGKLQKNVLRGALRAGAMPVRDAARENIHNESGELAAGIKVATKTQGSKVIAQVKVTGPHAFIGHMLEFTGAKPHPIHAKVGKALDIGGTIVHEVPMHPGFKPKPFLRPALDSQAGPAVVNAGEYMKARLATKEGIDTSDVTVEQEA